MAAPFLIDSNVLIDYIGREFKNVAEFRLDVIINDGFNYSIVSRMEVLGFNGPPDTIKSIESFLAQGNQYNISSEICEQVIQIKRILPKIKLPDLIIASTAIVHSYSLLTRNITDFKNIPGLKFENPWDWA